MEGKVVQEWKTGGRGPKPGAFGTRMRWTTVRKTTWQERALLIGLLIVSFFCFAQAATTEVRWLVPFHIFNGLAWAGNAYLTWHSFAHKTYELPPMDLATAKRFREMVNTAVLDLERREREREDQAGAWVH